MTLTFNPLLNTPTTTYWVQPGTEFLSEQYYRDTINPKTGRGSVHNAADYNARTGGNTDVGDAFRAIREGEVIDHGYDGYVGGGIELLLATGHIVGYWHGRDRHVVKGQIVRAGSVLGQVGVGGPRAVDRHGNPVMKAHLHLYIKKPGVKLPLFYWPSTHYPDKKAAEEFIRDHYENPVQFLRDSGALTTLADYEALFAPPELLVIRGDQTTNLTGKTEQFHGNGVTINAERNPFRVWVNAPSVGSIPALPPKK